LDISIIDAGWHIEHLEWGVLPGKRARPAGRNARLDIHGEDVPLQLLRITAAGTIGFGWSSMTRKKAESLLQIPIRDMFTADGIVRPEYRMLEFPLYDWLGKITGKPVYSMFAINDQVAVNTPFMVPCYDTSLYFDELHLQDDKSAVEFMKTEAMEGRQRGHRNFKLKVGRGARFMPLSEGLKRDIAVIHGIREVAGPEGRMMIDANNGYNLNLTKEVLAETKDATLYWIEEAFHEDPVLYQDLKQWMHNADLNVLIADGEGLAAQPLVQWAEEGLVDVLQYDILTPGFSFWLELGNHLDRHNVKTSPHSYGTPYGHFPLSHLASAVKGFQFVEWDEIAVNGLDTSGYKISEGMVIVPNAPGFGLHLDGSYYAQKVKETGWSYY
jgi:L-alanine-DL-glutamate epimerase-like enolase superfamily enzyme